MSRLYKEPLGRSKASAKMYGMGVSRFGNSSFDIGYPIEGGDGRLVATGRTGLVNYDYEKQSNYPIPWESIGRILDQQGRWQLPESEEGQ